MEDSQWSTMRAVAVRECWWCVGTVCFNQMISAGVGNLPSSSDKLGELLTCEVWTALRNPTHNLRYKQALRQTLSSISVIIMKDWSTCRYVPVRRGTLWLEWILLKARVLNLLLPPLLYRVSCCCGVDVKGKESMFSSCYCFSLESLPPLFSVHSINRHPSESSWCTSLPFAVRGTTLVGPPLLQATFSVTRISTWALPRIYKFLILSVHQMSISVTCSLSENFTLKNQVSSPYKRMMFHSTKPRASSCCILI